MAMPEQAAQESSESSTELRLVSGALVAGQSVEVVPVALPSFNEFAATILDESEWAAKNADELLEVRETISGFAGQKARHIHEQTLDHAAAISLLIRINGYIKDRR